MFFWVIIGELNVNREQGFIIKSCPRVNVINKATWYTLHVHFEIPSDERLPSLSHHTEIILSHLLALLHRMWFANRSRNKKRVLHMVNWFIISSQNFKISRAKVIIFCNEYYIEKYHILENYFPLCSLTLENFHKYIGSNFYFLKKNLSIIR